MQLYISRRFILFSGSILTLASWAMGAGFYISQTASGSFSADEAFVRSGAQPAQVTRAEVIANPSNTVVQGTMIQAVTETALDSTLPGAIRAIVSEDVLSRSP